MKFSEAWLREWVNPDLDTGALTERLTMAGLETESIEPVAGVFSAVVVGEVLSVDPHPDADKLRLCRVSAGTDQPLQIVCGAPNVRAGMKAPLARVGASLPDGTKIRESKLRGVLSQGMLCSARELGLSEEHAGLMELPADAPVGGDLHEYLGLDDTVIDIGLTPNRGDCLSIEGMAREVAALTGTALTPPTTAPVEASVAERFPIEVAAPAACPRYLGRVIRGIDPTVATPLWMQEKLRRCGIRSLGPVVDVTNYVLLELGQPMHAFDLDQVSGGIQVRYARAGERLMLLDERTVELEPEALLICDREHPLALAGIMGGMSSGVSERTQNLFLEVAFFSPEHLAGRARRYGLATDSSYRFERGVDPDLQHRAMERATALLLDLVGGEAGLVIEASSVDHLPGRKAVQLRRSRIERVLGFTPADDVVEDMLLRLGMDVEKVDGGWLATPPSWRFDLELEIDLIEEVGRVYGYDRLPTVQPEGELIMRPVPEATTPLDRVQALLADRDYQEVVTYSFVDAALLKALAPDAGAVALANPISSEMAVMRTTLWAGLIDAVKRNLARQQRRIRLFECGLNFTVKSIDIQQKRFIGGTITGERFPEQWAVAAQPVDFYDIKGDVEALLAGCGVEAQFRAGEHPALHPGQAAEVWVNGAAAGWLGCLHPRLAQRLEIPRKTYLFELELEPLLKGSVPRFQKLSRFPSIRRDLAIVVDAEVPVGALCAVIDRQAGQLLQETLVFDVYQGKGIENGRKSIAFGLILQDSSRTLTDQDVDAVMQAITGQLKEQFGATLRE
ncbi:MAG: phenylalanine--tRNA ligase subunit beta [Gammaproteobacteria bacterium]|jgi:phenylalanyl-tRNA synthetase beta chain